MSFLSMQSKKRVFGIGLTGLLGCCALLVQILILNRFSLFGVTCSLPLTLTILWGLVFGSPLPEITAKELRKQTLWQVFLRQASSGSLSGLLIGLFLGCLYQSIIPAYPLAFPIIGWLSGYFCLRGLSQGNLLCVPLVFVLTILAEALIAWELALLGRQGTFEHLTIIIFPEAFLNALCSPFIYFPLRGWYDLIEGQRLSLSK